MEQLEEAGVQHTPKWQQSDDEWHLIVGNRSVAKLIYDVDNLRKTHGWISLIDKNYLADERGWHAVDFQTLETGRNDIEQWWHYRCRGEDYRPCCPGCGHI